MSVSTIAEKQESGQVLLQWLSLLGWQTSIRRGGGIHGEARHVTKDNRPLVVRARGTSLDQVAVQLFERALGRLAVQ